MLVLPMTLYGPWALVCMSSYLDTVKFTYIYVLQEYNLLQNYSWMMLMLPINGHLWNLGTWFHITFASLYPDIVAITYYHLHDYNSIRLTLSQC
jgi:hypothetical protein